jgi:hypothetical protein
MRLVDSTLGHYTLVYSALTRYRVIVKTGVWRIASNASWCYVGVNCNYTIRKKIKLRLFSQRVAIQNAVIIRNCDALPRLSRYTRRSHYNIFIKRSVHILYCNFPSNRLHFRAYSHPCEINCRRTIAPEGSVLSRSRLGNEATKLYSILRRKGAHSGIIAKNTHSNVIKVINQLREETRCRRS